MFDQWSSSVWRRARSGMRDRDALWSLATVGVVCAITVVFGFVLGILVGIAMSIVLFVATQNRSLVRTVATAETMSSRRIYRDEQVAALREHGASVRIVELEGAIFFGTAHKLERELEAHRRGRALPDRGRPPRHDDRCVGRARLRAAGRARAGQRHALPARRYRPRRQPLACAARPRRLFRRTTRGFRTSTAPSSTRSATFSMSPAARPDDELPLATVALRGMNEAQRARLGAALAA